MLPALGEGGVEQRPIGSLVAKPHGEIDESRELATLKGSARIAVVMERLLWDRLVFEDVEIPVTRRRSVTVTRGRAARAGRGGAGADVLAMRRGARRSASGSRG